MFKPNSDLLLVNIINICSCLLLVICLEDDYSLQDVCPTAAITDPRLNKRTTLAVFINGLPCKDPANITASDFKSTGLTIVGDTDNILGSFTSIVSAVEYPGLNTLGLSIGRTDLDVGGLVVAHAHPRSSEIFFVTKGAIIAGFTDSGNRVFQKVVKEGDVFIVPRALMHFVFNYGLEPATVFSVFNSQNPGLVDVSGALFQFDPNAAKEITTRIISASISDSTVGQVQKTKRISDPHLDL
ncbi:hypothetical protein Dimus_011587 [Dionaea muscipula]